MVGVVGSPKPMPTYPVGLPSRESIAKDAVRLGLKVVISRTDKKPVTLTDKTLAALAKDPQAFLAKEAARPKPPAGLALKANDIADFFRALNAANRSATQSGERGVKVDLSNSGANAATVSKLYDNVHNNVPATAQVQVGKGTKITTDLGKSFGIRGKGMQTKEISGWDKLLNVLAQIGSRLLIFGWFAPPDSPTEKRTAVLRDNAGSIALAGGSALKKQLKGLSDSQGRGRIEELVRRANPKVDAQTVKDTARVLYGELNNIYKNSKLSDAQLDSLQHAVIRAPVGAFGGNVGKWLRARLPPGAAIKERAVDVLSAKSPAEIEATLTLSVPGYAAAPAAQKLAKELHGHLQKIGPKARNAMTTFLSGTVTLQQTVALNKLFAHPQFGKFRDRAQAQLMNHTIKNAAHIAPIESMLNNAATMGRGNDREFQKALARVQASNPAQVAEFNSLTGAAAFGGLPLAVRRNLLSVAAPGKTTQLTALVAHANFAGLSNSEKYAVSETIARAGSTHATTLINNIPSGGFTAAQVGQLEAVTKSADYMALSPAAKRLALQAVMQNIGTADIGTKVAGSLQSFDRLVNDQNFQSLPAAARQTIIAQLRNYPNSVTAENLRRLSSASWFRKPAGPPPLSTAMTAHQHQQRSVLMVAYTSAQIDLQKGLPAPTTGQTRSTQILQNTLDRFLPTVQGNKVIQGPFRVDWKSYGSASIYGSALNGVLHLNSAMVPASDAPLSTAPRLSPPRTPATESNAEHLLLNTVVHEVNHLMNGDRVRQTFEYFMGEYGAWYTGYRAAYGREPTRQQAYNRARFLLTRTTGAYNRLRLARLSTRANGTPSASAQAVINFMGQFFAPPPPVHTAASIVNSPHVPPNGVLRTSASAPPAGQNRNMDNSGTPQSNRSSGTEVGNPIMKPTAPDRPEDYRS